MLTLSKPLKTALIARSIIGSVLLSITTLACSSPVSHPASNQTASTLRETIIRVPAEWEHHEATWMQWPNEYEAHMRQSFANIIGVVKQYEPLHLITSSKLERYEAETFLEAAGVSLVNITWHIAPTDNAWMRDNGPIYVSNGKEHWIQDWKFDAWGGNFGLAVESRNDDKIPQIVADYLQLPSVEIDDYVLEKGNLEFNGAGVLMLNWDCQNQRNPGMTQDEHEHILKEKFGVHEIIWAYGYDPEDLTTGHIDGIARFTDVDTIAIADYGTETELKLAEDASAKGYEVIWYPSDPNWLVGNGFVVTKASGDASVDATAKRILQSLFPERDIHLIDVDAISESGGGIHCVTNDQPQFTL